ncbi:hypothetical protein OROMI_032256 [Orobanche minor]
MVVNIWNLKIYSCAITVPTYEALESLCAFGSASPFVSCLSSFTQKNGKETTNSPSIQFVTVGECGVVRIWNSDGAVLLFEQKSSDLAVSSKKEEVKRGFTSAMMLPLGQGLLCATVDNSFLFTDNKSNHQLKAGSTHSYSTLVRRSTASPSVIVIGAGFAGITAARALHDASFQVTVLESRDKIGGRVHTDYSFGFLVDLGASWHPELGLRRNLNQANF